MMLVTLRNCKSFNTEADNSLKTFLLIDAKNLDRLLSVFSGPV